MTFKEWLTSYLPDYEDEYSGTLAGDGRCVERGA